MRFLVFCLLLLSGISMANGQTYADSIAQFRQQYIAEHLADKHSPIKQAQVKNLSFFVPDRNYCVWADFKASPGVAPFLIPTHSGKDKPYKEYGTLTFSIGDSICVLHVYQSVDMVGNSAYKDYLFIPFTDETNYETTYAGGRYIDLTIQDIQGGKVLLDFNKCYNPYCAYADGFSCPIPPQENRLHVAINAGEKMFMQ